MTDTAFSEKTDPVTVVLPSYLAEGTGRRSLIHDQEIVDEVLDNVKAGNTQAVAAQAAGIAPATFYNWQRRAEIERTRIAQGFPPIEREAPYVEFLERLEQAEGQAEAGMVAEVRADPSGARWILPRRWPQRWSQTSRQAIQVAVQGARGTLDALPPEVREAVQALLVSRVGGSTDGEDGESDDPSATEN
jgi:hypothetical protein